MESIPQIDPGRAKEMLDKKSAVFVDIRDYGSYASAHIPGATHLSDDNVQEFIKNADKSRPLVVYCYHGNTSQGATAFFLEQGFKDAQSMMGGFEAWRGVYPHETA